MCHISGSKLRRIIIRSPVRDNINIELDFFPPATSVQVDISTFSEIPHCLDKFEVAPPDFFFNDGLLPHVPADLRNLFPRLILAADKGC